MVYSLFIGSRSTQEAMSVTTIVHLDGRPITAPGATLVVHQTIERTDHRTNMLLEKKETSHRVDSPGDGGDSVDDASLSLESTADQSATNQTSRWGDEGITVDPVAWSNLKVAVYMTTHLSVKHLKFLYRCWPSATKHLPLLQDSHLILFTSNEPPASALEALNFKSITIRRYTELPPNATDGNEDDKKQLGAKRAMLDPFAPENRWFDGYDWVIRLNPDVLIRRDAWIRHTMLNETADGIFIDYSRGRRKGIKGLHTDFYAFRPRAVNVQELQANFETKKTAETHLWTGFQDSIQQGRIAWLPNAERRHDFARVIGTRSPVIHFHPLFNKCPNYFNAKYQNIY